MNRTYRRINGVTRRALVAWNCPAPVRPVVLLQSDDWGRSGIPGPGSLEALRRAGLAVGASDWDFYGLESIEDLERLGETLAQFRDRDGRLACVTAVMVMANADLRRMRAEGFKEFRAVSWVDGFPAPWTDPPPTATYRQLMDEGLLYPALHGYTHFSPRLLQLGWHDPGEFGRRVRLLAENDVPYLASITAEMNFALLERRDGAESFAEEAWQRAWIDEGVRQFERAFGFRPLAACAPGYRANDVTRRLLAARGLRILQTAGRELPHMLDGLLVVPRTVEFEPALNGETGAVARALAQAEQAVADGKMIVVNTHSINYVDRFLARRERCLALLAELMEGLLKRFPDLRFAHEGLLIEALDRRDTGWFKPPGVRARWRRLRQLASALAGIPR